MTTQRLVGALLTFLTLSSIPLLTLSAKASNADSNNESVQFNDEGWWGTGVMVGTVARKSWEHGFIWESGELVFQAGDGIKSEKNYPPLQYNVSVQPEYQSLWEQLRPSNRPIVVRYKYPFWANPFATNSNYRAVEVQEALSSFSETASYQYFPNGIELPAQHRGSVLFSNYQTFGRVIHVARWGQYVMSHRCTVYLHLGGNQRIEERTPQVDEMWEYDPRERTYVLRTIVTYRVEHKYVPNVVQLYTYDENLCRYAEDTAVSQAQVYAEYSGQVGSAEEETYSILHAMKVED